MPGDQLGKLDGLLIGRNHRLFGEDMRRVGLKREPQMIQMQMVG